MTSRLEPEFQGVHLSGARVLIVEDEALIAELMADQLHHLGMRVVGMEDTGESAIGAALITRPDIVLMDIQLKGSTDGIAAAGAIRSQTRIPVVFLTAHSDEGTLTRARQATPYGYILKPFEIHDLRITLLMALNRRAWEIREEQIQQRWGTVLESMAEGVVVRDAGLGVRYMNPAARALAAWDERSASALLTEAGLSLTQRPAGGVHGEFTLPSSTGNGSSQIDCIMTPLVEDGAVKGEVWILRDITDVRRMQESLRQAERSLQQGQRLESIGRLCAGIAHDVNNMMMVVNGGAELLMQRIPAHDPAAALVQQVRHAGERASGLGRKLLSFAGRRVARRSELHVNQFLGELEPILARLLGERMKVQLTTDPTIEDVVNVDAGELEQAIVNLAINARDAMPDGGTLTVATRNVTSPESGACVEISVSDTGQGMNEGVLAHAFEPFFTTKSHGTGLGLASVYGFVKQCEGRVVLDSTPGQGTTVRLTLPCAPSTAGSTVSYAPPRAAAARDGSAVVLLVEDEIDVRRITRRILEDRGFDVVDVADGPAAEDAAEKLDRVDVLLTDVVMPNTDAQQLVSAVLRRQPQCGVVFMTGYADDSVLRLVPAGTNAELLIKPCASDQITDALYRVLGEHGEQRISQRG